MHSFIHKLCLWQALFTDSFQNNKKHMPSLPSISLNTEDKTEGAINFKDFYEPLEKSRNSGSFHVSPGFSIISELYIMSIKFSKESNSMCCHVGNLTKSEKVSS